tara:strand:- start:1929 stop:3521 length:1593 start_codon:yes stop_codon:yes gene_type:complete
MNEVISIDLYDHFINRFTWRSRDTVLEQYTDAPPQYKSVGSFTKREIFYGLFRILLACDAAHDFMSSRGNLGDDFKALFVQIMDESVKLDLGIIPGLAEECERLIRLISYDNWSYKIAYPNSYFNSDAVAKNTADRILSVFGLVLVPINQIGQTDCTGDYTITRMVKIINSYYRGAPGVLPEARNYFDLRIDATQDTLDMLPIYSAVLIEARKREAGCAQGYNLRLEEDISSVYDAANDDKLQKVLKHNNIAVTNIVNTDFNITCGGYNLIQCTLSIQGQASNGKPLINLGIIKYFQQDIGWAVNNDKIGQDSNNSVKGLTNLMIKDISEYAQNNGIPIGSPRLNDTKKKIIYKYSIFKTMGDFLQIASYINIPGVDKMFISADILSTKICSVLNRCSFIEKVRSPDYLVGGIGLYMTKAEFEHHQAASTLITLQTSFGKKSNKISNMSNEELKTKLKSVGINVTKLNSKGKRLPLTRKEMEKKAMMFKNLQLRAKKYNIKLKYESKRNGYVYKGFQRLLNEIQRKLKNK